MITVTILSFAYAVTTVSISTKTEDQTIVPLYLLFRVQSTLVRLVAVKIWRLTSITNDDSSAITSNPFVRVITIIIVVVVVIAIIAVVADFVVFVVVVVAVVFVVVVVAIVVAVCVAFVVGVVVVAVDGGRWGRWESVGVGGGRCEFGAVEVRWGCGWYVVGVR